jgi:protein gp37
MTDLFHRDVPDEYIRRIFDVMAQAPQHTFQVLTKHGMGRWVKDVSRAVELAPSLPWPSNVWMGASVESGRYAWVADRLRSIPAAVRWISAEPLLGSLAGIDLAGIDWLVGGGESGPGFRPVSVEHAREARDLCAAASVPFLWKQWGGANKKRSGRLLDGVLHDSYPASRAA